MSSKGYGRGYPLPPSTFPLHRRTCHSLGHPNGHPIHTVVPLHLKMDVRKVFYPLQQLLEQKDDQDKESVVVRYETLAGIVSECRGDGDRVGVVVREASIRGREERGRRRTVSYRRGSFPRLPHPSRSISGAAILTPLSGRSGPSLQAG